jgi:hypothetical protein
LTEICRKSKATVLGSFPALPPTRNESWWSADEAVLNTVYSHIEAMTKFAKYKRKEKNILHRSNPISKPYENFISTSFEPFLNHICPFLLRLYLDKLKLFLA